MRLEEYRIRKLTLFFFQICLPYKWNIVVLSMLRCKKWLRLDRSHQWWWGSQRDCPDLVEVWIEQEMAMHMKNSRWGICCVLWTLSYDISNLILIQLTCESNEHGIVWLKTTCKYLPSSHIVIFFERNIFDYWYEKRYTGWNELLFLNEIHKYGTNILNFHIFILPTLLYQC